MPQARGIVERFWEKVEKTDDCWLWTAAVNWRGYGRIKDERPSRRVITAHRLSYELSNGAIPDGLYVCHRCDNRRCVRPDHLFLGTSLDNNRDMVAKGRRGTTKGRFKTECKRGHQYDEANTYVAKNGHRACRKCCNLKQQRLYWAKRPRVAA